MERADNHVDPNGELVGVDLTDTDGEGTVCTEAEARWYEEQGRVDVSDPGDPLTLEEFRGS